MPIRKIDATTGIITVYLALGTDTGDNGPRISASVARTKSIFIHDNKMYFGTEYCHVRVIDMTTDIITTIAGYICESYDSPAYPYYFEYFRESGEQGVSALSVILSPNPAVTGEDKNHI